MLHMRGFGFDRRGQIIVEVPHAILEPLVVAWRPCVSHVVVEPGYFFGLHWLRGHPACATHLDHIGVAEHQRVSWYRLDGCYLVVPVVRPCRGQCLWGVR